MGDFFRSALAVRGLLTKMSSPPQQTNKTSLQPTRTYQVPGGPLAKNLGSVDVYKLADIERGGDKDNVR